MSVGLSIQIYLLLRQARTGSRFVTYLDTDLGLPAGMFQFLKVSEEEMEPRKEVVAINHYAMA